MSPSHTHARLFNQAKNSRPGLQENLDNSSLLENGFMNSKATLNDSKEKNDNKNSIIDCDTNLFSPPNSNP